jgi:hypothetical protein
MSPLSPEQAAPLWQAVNAEGQKIRRNNLTEPNATA